MNECVPAGAAPIPGEPVPAARGDEQDNAGPQFQLPAIITAPLRDAAQHPDQLEIAK